MGRSGPMSEHLKRTFSWISSSAFYLLPTNFPCSPDPQPDVLSHISLNLPRQLNLGLPRQRQGHRRVEIFHCVISIFHCVISFFRAWTSQLLCSIGTHGWIWPDCQSWAQLSLSVEKSTALDRLSTNQSLFFMFKLSVKQKNAYFKLKHRINT